MEQKKQKVLKISIVEMNFKLETKAARIKLNYCSLSWSISWVQGGVLRITFYKKKNKDK